MRAFYVAFPI